MVSKKGMESHARRSTGAAQMRPDQMPRPHDPPFGETPTPNPVPSREAVEHTAMQATPHAELIAHIMDSRIAKNEREWAAAREIERLLAEVERLNKLANYKFSGCPSLAEVENVRDKLGAITGVPEIELARRMLIHLRSLVSVMEINSDAYQRTIKSQTSILAVSF